MNKSLLAIKIFSLLMLLNCGHHSNVSKTEPHLNDRGPAEESHHHHESLSAGGRRGLHGMVLFGQGPYFMEHIPMLSPPHDFQIITEVTVKNVEGKKINLNFAHQLWTVRPAANFSLNDFVSGRLSKFEGAIYRGSFEQNGKQEKGLEKVTFEIQKRHLIRKLPNVSNENEFTLNDDKNEYRINIIRQDDNVQRIENRTIGKTLWCVTAPDFFQPCSKP